MSHEGSRFFLASVLTAATAALLLGCGGDAGAGDDDGGPDEVDAGSSSLNPNDCAGIASGMVAAAQACGTPLPSNAAAQIESVCRRGVGKADVCGGDATAGMACFRTPDPTDWVCAGGEPYPSCDGDLGAALGMYCVLSMGTPSCASGIACRFDSDCGGGDNRCNSATSECFDTTAYCVGLPCRFDSDCPGGSTCNSAERACVGG